MKNKYDSVVITAEYVDHLDALAKAATPGDRLTCYDRVGESTVLVGHDVIAAVYGAECVPARDNATFVAACSPETIQALTAALREAWASLATVQEGLRIAVGMGDSQRSEIEIMRALAPTEDELDALQTCIHESAYSPGVDIRLQRDEAAGWLARIAEVPRD